MSTAIINNQISLGRAVSKQTTSTGDFTTDVNSLSVADGAVGATSEFVDITVDVSKLSLVYLISTQAVTLNTNDNSVGTPTETIDLVADEPLLWRLISGSLDYPISPFSSDITAGIHIDNSSGSAATINMMFLIDSSLT